MRQFDMRVDYEPFEPPLIVDLDQFITEHHEGLDYLGDIHPRWDVYINLHTSGKLRCYTVRDNGYLVGYALFIIEQSLHNYEITVAMQDSFYLDPKYRKGRNGLRFIEAIEAMLKSEGIDMMMVTFNTGSRAEQLFDRLDYERAHSTYMKRL